MTENLLNVVPICLVYILLNLIEKEGYKRGHKDGVKDTLGNNQPRNQVGFKHQKQDDQDGKT